MPSHKRDINKMKGVRMKEMEVSQNPSHVPRLKGMGSEEENCVSVASGIRCMWAGHKCQAGRVLLW